MSEYAARRDRGRMVSLVFAMQGVGLVVGPLVAIALLATDISHDMAWRRTRPAPVLRQAG